MGGGGSSAGGLGGLLGGLMGGGAPSTFGGGGGPSLPFADVLAEKLGISPQMANTLIMGAIGLLTASMAKKQAGGRAMSFNSVNDPDFIRSSGVASQMSAQMGISEDDAVMGLQQAMGLMAQQSGLAPSQAAPAPAKKKTKKTTGTTTARKSTAKATKTTPKKKPAKKKEAGSDFMDLLDDPR